MSKTYPDRIRNLHGARGLCRQTSVANSGTSAAEIGVTGPGGFSTADSVPAGELKSIVLPWVPELKGPEFSRVNTSEGRAKDSVLVSGGAYHLTSTIPVTAWQFSPLQYKNQRERR